MELIAATGPWMYPLLGIGLCLLVAVVRAGFAIGAIDDEVPAAGPPHHSIIVWGVLSVVVGLLGTVIGFGRVAVGARATAGVDRADLAAMLAVILDGAMVIVTPITVGLWLLTIALVAWLALHFALGRRLS